MRTVKTLKKLSRSTLKQSLVDTTVHTHSVSSFRSFTTDAVTSSGPLFSTGTVSRRNQVSHVHGVPRGVAVDTRMWNQQRRYFSTSARPPQEPEESGPGIFDTLWTCFSTYMNQLWTTKKSTSVSDKNKHVSENIPKFLDTLSKDRDINPGTIADILISISYTTPSRGVKFKTRLPRKVAQGFGGTAESNDITFTLVDEFTQRLMPEDLGDLPWNVEPGTAVHVWESVCNGVTRTFVVFRGTNSVGGSRDARLGHYDGTGALANCAQGEIGAGIVNYWLSREGHPLKKYLNKVHVVIGHSLGGGLAQDYAEAVLKHTGKAPIGYFASAPGRGRAPDPRWERFLENFFYTKSTQDFVPLGGIYNWPGMVLQFGPGETPIQPGLINSAGDRLFIQHGALISILKTLKERVLTYTPRTGTRLSTELSNLDESDWGPFGWELMDTLRPFLMKFPFTPTIIESIMKQLADYHLDEEFGRGENQKRGLAYGTFVHFVAELTASEFVAARYINRPYDTLYVLLHTFREVFRQDDLDVALTKIFEALSHIETNIFVKAELSPAAKERLRKLVLESKRAFFKQGIKVE